MALTVNHPLLKEQTFYTYLADVSTASSAYILASFRGKIVKLGTVLHGAIGTADSVVTVKINGTAVTGGAITVANSGSAAKDVDTAVPTALNVVNEGDVIEFATDGASSNTIPLDCFAIIQAL